ncbi:MAG TPA: TIR domain-containing protein [Candidatus Didemnitutus sp.]|nr:TIR domain-containing protein [Candidatus Didemnitutus sp.]
MTEPSKAVFLSYASQDAQAARRICDTLRAAGIEVWFDQSELRGGDAWDQKIRKQIKECALFIPIISNHTQNRPEGYFRLEWRLADQRTHLMGRHRAFLLPVCVDQTPDADADVPDSFCAVQWTRLPVASGEDAAAGQSFAQRVRNLLHAEPRESTAPVPDGQAAGSSAPQAAGNARAPRGRRPLIASVVVVAAVVTIAWFMRPAQPAPVDKGPKSPPVSEARQLADRATEIRSRSWNIDDMHAAEELCNRAIALDPLDGHVWAVAASIDTQLYAAQYDHSDERRQSAQQKSARALALAPDLFEARWARAIVLVYTGNSRAMRDEGEKLMRQLAAEKPPAANRQFYSDYGTVLRSTGHYAEAAAIFEQIGDLQSAGWNYCAADDVDAAEKAADRLLAAKRTAGAIGLKCFVVGALREDPEGVRRVVDLYSPSELLEVGPMLTVVDLALIRREPDRAIAVLNDYPEEFIFAADVAEPKRYYIGLAHEMAGRTAAATAEWERALQLVTERQKAKPNDRDMLAAQALLLACLSRKPEAEKAYQLLLGLTAVGGAKFDDCWIPLRLGRSEEVLALLTRRLTEKSGEWWVEHSSARFQPQWDPLRSDPRFQKLLRDTLPRGAKPFDDVPPVASTAAVDGKSVAVLAFANLSDDKNNEYFSDGVSEELLNVLAKVPGLKVAARTSAFYFKGRDVPVADIAHQLGVAYVIEGSVRRSGERVRITAQLIKAADGFEVWTDTFTRELKDVFAVQDEIAAVIAQNLSLKLRSGTASATAAVNPEAFELYLRARQFWNQRTLDAFTQAEQLLNQALALAPDFARAHAALADVWTSRAVDDGTLGTFGQRNASSGAKIAAEIRRALELDPNLAEAHAALGNLLMMTWRYDEAAVEFRRAVELNPNYASGHQWLSRWLWLQGYVDESLVEMRRAAELDPLSHRILDNLSALEHMFGRYEVALALDDRALALQPNAIQAASWKARDLLALGRTEEALAVVRQYRIDQSPGYSVFAVAVLARAGHTREAEELSTRIARSDGKGWALAMLGRPQEAVAEFEADNFDQALLGELLLDSDFDGIRDDPRITGIIATLGGTEANARVRVWRAAHPLPKLGGQK